MVLVLFICAFLIVIMILNGLLEKGLQQENLKVIKYQMIKY